MTRVEKYRDYRREISEMRVDQENTKKHQSSLKVDELLENDCATGKLSYDDVAGGLNIYDFKNQKSATYPNYLKKRLGLFYTIMGLIIVGLLVALIIVGKAAFGG